MSYSAIIFLVELSDKLPQSKEEFLSLNGIGESKWEKIRGGFFYSLRGSLNQNRKKKLTKTYLENAGAL